MPGYIELPDRLIAWTEKAAIISRSGKLSPAACTSITMCLRAWKLPQREAWYALKIDKPVHLFLREPVDRFASVYAYFANRTWPYGTFDRITTLEQFTDRVLEGERNEHWLPQIEQHTLHGQLVPDKIIRLDAIDTYFPKGYQLGRLNQNTLGEKPEISYRLDELHDYYRRDLEEYAAAYR